MGVDGMRLHRDSQISGCEGEDAEADGCRQL